MAGDDRDSRSTQDGQKREEILITRDFADHAIYQFPSERILHTKEPRRDAGFPVSAGGTLFEHPRARWSARTQEEPDLSVLLVRPDSRGRRRALGSAVVVAILASVLAIGTRYASQPGDQTIPPPRLAYASEMSAGRVNPVPAPERSLVTDVTSVTAATEVADRNRLARPAFTEASLRLPLTSSGPVSATWASPIPATFEVPAPEEALPPALPGGSLDSTAALATSSPLPLAGPVPPDRGAAPPIATASSPIASATAGAAAAPIDERQVINQVLGRYQAAFSKLDASAAQAVWPQVDRRALERGFSQLERQTVTLRSCNVSVQSRQATAECSGQTTYVPKVGSRSERTESRAWTFDLQKTGDRWLIARVDSR